MSFIYISSEEEDEEYALTPSEEDRICQKYGNYEQLTSDPNPEPEFDFKTVIGELNDRFNVKIYKTPKISKPIDIPKRKAGFFGYITSFFY